MAFKKKLHRLNPSDAVQVDIQQTKREKVAAQVTPENNERYLREMLANKVSGSHMGLWLLVPEYLRLGAWDLLRGLFPGSGDIPARLAMQTVNESALCINRIRRKDSLCHQGFSLVNGLSFLAADEPIHRILDSNSVSDYEGFQSALMKIRMLEGHYQSENLILAIDPHRIVSTTKRAMVRKKKRPDLASEKMMQTFFCNDTATGQPLAFMLSASGKTCSQATTQLLELVEESLGSRKALILADKEHFTKEIAERFGKSNSMEILMPAPELTGIKKQIHSLDYTELWPGYSVAESVFSFQNSSQQLRLIAQKESSANKNEVYKPFLTTSQRKAEELLSCIFPKRWSIEEFFNREGDMAWNRASSFNLNTRYGRQSLALLAQAAVFGLRKNLPKPFSNASAGTISEKILTNMEGDVRVSGDTIIVTYYKDHEILGLRDKYQNISQKLEQQNISPKIPWLYDFKLDFRFK